jgi:uncharacterized protein YjaG (DUF416 family)
MEKCNTIKTEKVLFRVNKDLHDFMISFAHQKGMTTSELCRNILNYWFMSYFTGDLRINYDSLKEKFLCVMKELDEEDTHGR